MKDKEEALFNEANTQEGLFTATQAEKAGYKPNNFPYYVAQGKWEKLGRGIYRLKLFPESQCEHLMYWYLWSRNKKGEPQGVISHATALYIYELSDYIPRRVNLTVPKKFFKSAKIPPKVIIHKANLSKIDVSDAHGLKVTTVLRTILDLIEDKALSEEFIEQAVKEAKKRGLLTQMDFRNHPILGRYIV